MPTDRTRPGLASLLDRLPRKRFLDKHWPETPLVVHGDPRRLRGLADLPELEDADSIAQMQCAALSVQSRDKTGAYFSIDIAPAQASALYRSGMTLYANDVRSLNPGLGDWVVALEEELSLPEGTIRPSVLASQKGAGVRMHFDAQEGFIVQVRGRKRWRIAPNRHLRWPPTNYVTGKPLPPELEPLAPNGLPQAMPADAEDVELRPGSVLFLPRGYWHETETLEDSVHIDLMVPVPTYADVIWPLLREKLEQLPEWRQPATGVDAAKRIDALLSDARKRLEKIDARELLSPREAPKRRRG